MRKTNRVSITEACQELDVREQGCCQHKGTTVMTDTFSMQSRAVLFRFSRADSSTRMEWLELNKRFMCAFFCVMTPALTGPIHYSEPYRSIYHSL